MLSRPFSSHKEFFMPLACFPLGPLQTNSYLLHNDTQALAIDVGGDPQPMIDYLNQYNLTLEAICLTHLHFDHTYGVAELKKATKCQVYASKGDDPIKDTEASQGGIWGFPLVESFVNEDLPLGEKILAGFNCKVLSTPGHTPGGVSLYFKEQGLVFVGDALFYRSIGRTDFPLGNFEQLITAIKTQLFTLPQETRVLPGHGPETTIQDEKLHNPICGDFVL